MPFFFPSIRKGLSFIHKIAIYTLYPPPFIKPIPIPAMTKIIPRFPIYYQMKRPIIKLFLSFQSSREFNIISKDGKKRRKLARFFDRFPPHPSQCLLGYDGGGNLAYWTSQRYGSALECRLHHPRLACHKSLNKKNFPLPRPHTGGIHRHIYYARPCQRNRWA